MGEFLLCEILLKTFVINTSDKVMPTKILIAFYFTYFDTFLNNLQTKLDMHKIS